MSSIGFSSSCVMVTLCSSHIGILSERNFVNSSCEPKPHQGSGGSLYGGTQTPIGHGDWGSCGRITSLSGGWFFGQGSICNGSFGLAPVILEEETVSSSEFVS